MSDAVDPAWYDAVRTTAGRLAYVDVGEGPPVVFLHGNPTGARLYRHLIRGLAPDYRCVAPDHLGFGRSDAPAGANYRPPAHATRVEGLLRQLALSGVTLVLHDWGGPIGLAVALRHPGRIRRLVLMNTWAWPLPCRPLVRLFGGIVGTALGRHLIERHNLFPRVVMPWTVGPAASTDWIRPYAEALDTPARRHACWAFANGLLGETPWLRALWTRRHRLRDCPALLCWGTQDPAFGRPPTLRRWTRLFGDVTVRRFPAAGHYLPEEAGPQLLSPVRSFLSPRS